MSAEVRARWKVLGLDGYLGLVGRDLIFQCSGMLQLRSFFVCGFTLILCRIARTLTLPAHIPVWCLFVSLSFASDSAFGRDSLSASPLISHAPALSSLNLTLCSC
jgi:hypothetical protein